MRSIPLLLVGAVALAACSSFKAADVPGCHGPRRTANPYGSVLAPSTAPPLSPSAPAVAPAAGCGSPRA